MAGGGRLTTHVLDTARALKQLLASFGQYHAARRTYEKLCAEFYLQLPYLHADCCLRNVHAQGSGGECSALGNRRECSQLSDFHRRSEYQ